MSTTLDALFAPLSLRNLTLRNRIAMAPMTRSFSPGGVPGADVAAYYRRRAAGGVGLIITEGVYPPHPLSGFDPKVPHLEAGAAVEGWRTVVQAVHEEGGRIFAQIWHTGQQISGPAPRPDQTPVGPDNTSIAEVEQIIASFGEAAALAQSAGFDGVELHGAHGYLIDQFFWEQNNHRQDLYGGSLEQRTRFAAGIAREVRRRTGPDFPLALRFSQWKIADYNAKLAHTPQELERFLTPLTEAGIDMFHASTRRFFTPEFPGEDARLGLAGWTRKISGKPTIAVGSVTLGADVMSSFASPQPVAVTGLEDLLERMDRGEFDIIAIGRSLIANPDWPQLVQSGQMDRLQPYRPDLLSVLR